MILNKWKLFALRQYLSEWHGDEMELFHALENDTREDLEKAFEKHGVNIWYPFEYMDIEELANIIVGAACDATNTEIKG